MIGIRPAALCFLALLAHSALAGRVELPLRIPLEPLREALGAQLGTTYREGRCRFVRLEAPALESAGGRLHLSAPGAAALGLELLGACRNAAAWRGSMHFTLEPQLDAAGRLRVRIVDSRLTDAGGSTPALGLLWELVKRQVHPRLQRFSFDLGASRDALLGVVRSAAPPQQHAQLEEALRRVEIGEPQVGAAEVTVPIALELPDAWLAAPAVPAASAAPLSEAELEALDRALEPWDAFLAYTVKQFALDSPDERLRRRLFTLLLDSRYRLSAILAGEESAPGDPARALFLEAWSELRSIIADAQREGVLDPSLLRYAMFVDGADALVALDRAAPGLGLQLSADGLRRLARSLRPGAAGDPLEFGWSVDPQLAELFNVEELPAPVPPPGRSWLDFIIAPARADSGPEEKALDRWVPRRDEFPAYEARIGELLRKAAVAELQRAQLAAPYGRTYEHLMPTTALIESCWRQYVVRRGKVTYLRSAAASVGIMQINQRVWRGFYEVEKLRWDTAYNVRAGAQILMRYVKDYAIPYAEKAGEPDYVPRAAYAVYNAGPRAVGRFAKAKPHPREKRVDDHLWTLYQGIAAGGRADLRSCGVELVAASK
jgi:hypothetical protein